MIRVNPRLSLAAHFDPVGARLSGAVDEFGPLGARYRVPVPEQGDPAVQREHHRKPGVLGERAEHDHLERSHAGELVGETRELVGERTFPELPPGVHVGDGLAHIFITYHLDSVLIFLKMTDPVFLISSKKPLLSC